MSMTKQQGSKVKETPFSQFFRTASSKEKKRVYAEVLKEATERQKNQIEQAFKSKGGIQQ
ncbi:MAG: hypothetical protein HUJ16_08880 [Kangiella sp.]|nr:hypothetical protein [Kangiella sp.]